jgi:5'-nucleotidase
MRILLTNDDGIRAPGIAALYRAASGLGELCVVAPAQVQSAASHAVTFHQPLATRRVRIKSAGGKPLFEGVSVAGRPADCVKLAIANLVPGPVDLVLSGINCGANIGINVIYSGTVAAAMEAGFMGIPAIALSLHVGGRAVRWGQAAACVREALDLILRRPLKPHTVLNLNIPILDGGAPPRGLRVVPISTSPLLDSYQVQDGRGRSRDYTPGPHMRFRHTPPGSDVEALLQGYATLTPLHFDLTEHRQLASWARTMGRRDARGRVGEPPGYPGYPR